MFISLSLLLILFFCFFSILCERWFLIKWIIIDLLVSFMETWSQGRWMWFYWFILVLRPCKVCFAQYSAFSIGFSIVCHRSHWSYSPFLSPSDCFPCFSVCKVLQWSTCTSILVGCSSVFSLWQVALWNAQPTISSPNLVRKTAYIWHFEPEI